jgi:hypothetical protein
MNTNSDHLGSSTDRPESLSKAAKHTRGPWKEGDYIIWPANHGNAQFPIHAPKRGRIAMADRQSDARLISAAPELLEVLREIVSDGVHCDVVPHLHRKALAAIAKATT